MRERFVLVTHGAQPEWGQTLSAVIEPYGSLSIADEQVLDDLGRQGQAIVILDATAVTDWEAWVSRARAVRPSVPIIIARAIPDWRAERKAIVELGVAGHIDKTEDRRRLATALGRILQGLGSL